MSRRSAPASSGSTRSWSRPAPRARGRGPGGAWAGPGRLGGTCLIRGCIPSKALIHAAERFAGISDAVGGNALGMSVNERPALDFSKTVAWKDGIVDRLAGGVAILLVRAKVRVLRGWAKFSDAKT